MTEFNAELIAKAKALRAKRKLRDDMDNDDAFGFMTPFMRDVQRGSRQAGLGLIDLGMDAAEALGYENSPVLEDAMANRVDKLRAEQSDRGIKGLPGEIIADPISQIPIVKGARLASYALSGGLSGLLNPTKEGESRALNTAVGTGAGAAGGKALDLVGGGLRQLSNFVLPKADQAIIKEAIDAGLPVTAGQAYGGEAAPRLEGLLSQMTIAGAPIRAKREALNRGTQDIITSAADNLSTAAPETAEAAGRLVRGEVAASAGRVQEKISEPFNKLLANLPDDIGIPVPSAKAALDKARQEVGADSEALDYLAKDVFENVTSGNIAGKDLKQRLRKRLEARAKSQAARDLGLTPYIRDISKALDNDIESAVTNGFDLPAIKATPETMGDMPIAGFESPRIAGIEGAGEAYRAANRAYGAGKQVIDDLLGMVKNPNATDEKLIQDYLRMANQPTKGTTKGANAKLWRTVQRRFDPAVRDQLESFRLRQMGINERGEFDAAKAVREFESLSPQSQKMTLINLDPDKRKAWKAATGYISNFKGTLNPSGTAGAVIDAALPLAGVGTATLLSGEPPSAQTVIGSILIPALLGRGMGSTAVAKTINKLPRNLVEGPLTVKSRQLIVKELVKNGLKPEEAEEITAPPETKSVAPSEYSPELLERARQLRGASGQTSNGGDESGPLRITVTPDDSLGGGAGEDDLSQLQQDEGLMLAGYDDTTGNRTVGYGFNMDSGIGKRVWKKAKIATPFDDVYNGAASITPAEAEQLHIQSRAIAVDDAMKVYPKLSKLSPSRQQALVNLSYNLGLPRLKKFTEFNAAVNKGDWTRAANALMKSEYRNQVGDRAIRISRELQRNA